LTLDSRQVRNRIAASGLDRIVKARPPVLFLPHFADRIRLGNVVDDFDWLRKADWIVEAVVEDLAVKRDLMARIEAVRQPECIVSTNTSGIPVAAIGEGRSSSFRAHFLGTHFFNPPRYMKLLEIVPHADTDPAVTDRMVALGQQVLGKGIVLCKDTPNFIANRLASQAWHDIDYALAHGYTVEEVDAIAGPLLGRPNTAIFRLRDLVGLDTSSRVVANLYAAIPHDPFREALMTPRLVALREAMLGRGWLGNKTGQGFYKPVTVDGKRQFWPLNLETLTYEPPAGVDLPTVTAARAIPSLKERLRFLVSAEDRVGQFVWAILSNLLVYSAACIPEITEDITAIDRALKWGFGHELGPFEIWDALGVAQTCARIESDGKPVPAWVKEMLARGQDSFYVETTPRKIYGPIQGRYEAAPADARALVLGDLKTARRVVLGNPGASLIDMGDGVACLEFHAKANALSDDVRAMLDLALPEVERGFDGMVIGNQGVHFCAGADLNVYLEVLSRAAETGDCSDLERRLTRTQESRMAYRFFARPIVAAPFGMTLGGGAELMMSASAICAAAEATIGLVETGVGLIPGGCGCKEMLRRVVSPPMRTPGVDPLPFLHKVFENLAWAKTSSNAEEARDMGFLTDCDRIVMHPDYLLAEAKAMVLAMLKVGYRAPARDRNIYAVGQRGLASLRVAIYQRGEEGAASEYDMKLAEKIAYVLCGGDLPYPQWVDEQYILDLERSAFLSLVGQVRTLDRIRHMLATGARLRN
jgi:3-hydroxyacyl-CoA dehydrogenase